MSGRSVREQFRGAAELWSLQAERLRRRWGALRETRLYAQTLLAGGLVLLVWLSQAFPVGPLTRVWSAAVWTVTEQTDLAGYRRLAEEWAHRHGGWVAAVEATWSRGTAQLQEWVAAIDGEWLPADRPTLKRQAPSTGGPGSIQALKLPEPPVMPVRGAVLTPFGWSSGSEDQFHEGIDLMADSGSTVVAAAAGTVRLVGASPKDGTYVEVEHGPVVALYAQVEGVAVRAGQTVRKGEAIARVAPPRGPEAHLPAHLHFEVRTGDGATTVDPAAYLGLGGTRL